MRPRHLALAAALLTFSRPADAWQDAFFHTRAAPPAAGSEVSLERTLAGPHGYAAEGTPALGPLREGALELSIAGRMLLSWGGCWSEDLEREESRFSALRGALSLRLGGEDLLLQAALQVEYEERDPALEYAVEVADWDFAAAAPPGGPGRRRTVKARLLLSEELGPLDVAANLFAEADLRTGVAVLGYSAGALWGLGPVGGGEDAALPRAALGIGLEAHGLLGDLAAPAPGGSGAMHHLGPVLLWRPAPGWTIKAQAAVGLANGEAAVRLAASREVSL
jgi:hypothetical protein